MKDWPANRIKRRKVADLIPSARNARTHSDGQIEQIAASINQWGWTTPALVDETGAIIAGHGRVMAAQKLGIKEVPTVTAKGWTDAEKKAYALADNQLPMNAGWDMDLLKVELADLNGAEFDLSLLGFDDDMLSGLLVDGTEGLTDPDAVPDVPDDPVTREGDIWLLGEHRVMCGDSTCIDTVQKLMNDKLADFCFTSPPYGNQRDYKTPIDDWQALMSGVYAILPVKDGAQVLVNLGLIHSEKEWQPYWTPWVELMRTHGWLRFGLYVWDQGAGMMGDHQGRLAPSFEFIFHFCKESKRAAKTAESKLAGRITGAKARRRKDGTIAPRTGAGKPVQETKVRDGVIRVNRQLSVANARGHPAPFPVELCKEVSLPWVKRGDICFDPFTGSGTQIINCEQEGFIFHGMELAPTYVDVAVQRWQDFTGNDAVLSGTDHTYSELSEKKKNETA